MVMDSPERLMRRALQLALRGQGYVEPNPMVGAVLVRAGEQVAGGWHRRFGGPHAEVEALADARGRGIDPAGCEMYVTLEPCCHHGKTPPCTEALIAAGLTKVHVALLDPFDAVAGRGVAQLREAGVEVEVGLCEAEARRLNAPYLKRLATGLPWVIAKWAQTLDGRIATAGGDSRWISNEQSRKYVHQLRGRVDAVMVGIGTALQDDPLLTARHGRPRRQAQRVIVDPDLRLPPSAQVLGAGPPVTLAARQAVLDRSNDAAADLAARDVELFGLPEGTPGTSRLPLAPLLAHLAERHAATNVLVEGGAALFGTLLAQDLVDQVIAFVAPKLLGDQAALSAVTGLAADRIADARRLDLEQVKRFGDDVMLSYLVPRASSRGDHGG